MATRLLAIGKASLLLRKLFEKRRTKDNIGLATAVIGGSIGKQISIHEFAKAFATAALHGNGALLEGLVATEGSRGNPNPFKVHRARLDMNRARRCILLLCAGSLDSLLGSLGEERLRENRTDKGIFH